MPKDRRRPPRAGGVSQHVRETEFTNPFIRSTARNNPILKAKVTVLGPQAREREIQASNDQLKQKLLSRSNNTLISTGVSCLTFYFILDMDASSRQLLEDIQKEAGVPTMNDSFAIEDYAAMLPDSYEPDDSWLDVDNEGAAPPETMNLIQAARDLRISQYV